MAGLILALFAINMFGETLVRLVAGLGDAPPTDFMAGMREQFFLLGGILVVIAFFSYQSVQLLSGRLSGRERFQERLLGLIFGAANGYLVVGGLWSLLEFRVGGPEGWTRLPPGVPYVFAPQITRPISQTPGLELLLTHLPLPWLDPWLPILIILIFLFLIVAII